MGYSLCSCSLLFGEWKETSLLKDAWSGEEAFSISYPSLFALAANKEASVTDVWEPSREGGGWTPCFVRLFNDWEVEEIQNLFQAIKDKRILPSQDDLIIMREAINVRFSMKLSIRFWLGQIQSFFPISLFGVLEFPPRWFFCLGSFLGQSVDS